MPLVVLAKSDFVENKLMIPVGLMLDNIETMMIKLYMNGIILNLFSKDHSGWIVVDMNYE